MFQNNHALVSERRAHLGKIFANCRGDAAESVKLSDMNILIENAETLEYLNAAGKWTKNPMEAKSFAKTEIAFRAARLEAIGRFTIVFHISQTNQFINLNHGRGQGLPEISQANA